ncbi:MAG: hypothetical protein KF727_10320 [Microbacteriaceae bacterium]|nr:hypothetical protein [Microbacteriaceae bacterium]
MAMSLDTIEVQGGSGDHRFVTGMIDGARVSSVSAGIGCPVTALVVEELADLGVRTVLRIGTCGALQPDLKPGVMVVASAAVSGDGTSRAYGAGADPAVADIDVVAALLQACEAEGVPHVTGVVRSHDAFYLESPWARGDFRDRVQVWIDSGVLALENESSALFSVAALRGLSAGSILASGYPILDHPADFSHGEENKVRMVRVALSAAVRMAQPTIGLVQGAGSS